MINFRNFTAAAAVAFALISAPALANERATHPDASIGIPSERTNSSARTDGLGGTRISLSQPHASPGGPASSSSLDDPSQPETATGLDLNGPPRRFHPSELIPMDPTLLQ
jgi:hypothetical protein